MGKGGKGRKGAHGAQTPAAEGKHVRMELSTRQWEELSVGTSDRKPSACTAQPGAGLGVCWLQVWLGSGPRQHR